jgi:CHAT domain-containing protein
LPNSNFLINNRTMIKTFSLLSTLSILISNQTLLVAPLMASERSSVVQATTVTLQNEKLAQQTNNSKADADRLMEEGNRLLKASQYALAASSFEQALAIYRQINDSQGKKVAIDKLYGIYMLLGAWGKMTQLSPETTFYGQGARTNNPEPSVSAAQAVTQFLQLQNYAKSAELLERSLAALQKSGNRREETSILPLLGIAYLALQNPAKSIEYSERLVNLSREFNDLSSEIGGLQILGVAYSQRGDTQKAIAVLENGLSKVRTSSYKNRYPDAYNDREIEFSISLGNVYLTSEDYGRAISYSQQAISKIKELAESTRQRGTTPKFSEGSALLILGEAQFKSNQLVEAEKNLKRALQTYDANRIAFGNSALSNSFGKNMTVDLLDRASLSLQEILIAQNQQEAALEVAEQGRARDIADILAKRLPSQANLQSLDRRCQQLAQQQVPTFYPSSSQQPFSEVTSQMLTAIFQQRCENPDRLARSANPTNIEQIKQIAQVQNATIVEYSIISDQNIPIFPGKDRELFIWVVQPSGKVTFRKGNLKATLSQQHPSLENMVAQFLCFDNDTCRQEASTRSRSRASSTVLSNNSAFNQQAADAQTIATSNTGTYNAKILQKLHNLLISPIADLLPKNDEAKVIFIPHRSLFNVPFAALQDETGKYLIEKHTILTAPAIDVLTLTHQQRQQIQRQANEALIVGIPWQDILETASEANKIADLLNTQAVIGKQATKALVLDRMPKAHIIHLATHGTLDDVKGLGIPGAIALVPSSYSDGWLTSSEILDLKLGANLVVLSACQTGKGIITGDGVVGLSRSFISAGVPSVIVSLWSVPDAPTAELMPKFYKYWLKGGMNKAQALRRAMLDIMKTHNNPKDWAAFTLIGEAD